MSLSPPVPPPAEPGPSCAPKATPSNAAEVARALEFRGVKPSVADYDRRFDKEDESEAIIRRFLRGHLGLCGGDQQRQGDSAAAETCFEGIVGAFDGAYNTETSFNVKLFKAISECFEADNGSIFSVEYVPPKSEWSEEKKVHPSFMVITNRRRRKGDELGIAGEREKVYDSDAKDAAASDASIVALSTNKRLKSDAAQERATGAPGGEAGDDEETRREPFLAHAQFCTNVTANFDERAASGKHPPVTKGFEEGERQTSQRPPSPQQIVHRREYALGFAREVHIPANKYGIIQNVSYLDHAVVLFSRDPTQKKKTDKGWSVCRVLATVELRMQDESCSELERMDDNLRIKIKGKDLAKGMAAPLGQEVLYTFGHVVWSRAALGLALPASLPMAVIAARKRNGDSDVRVADKRMRWVYGNLVIPEECGGRFSFNVTSCGAFLGTNPKSAAAAYMTVLMEGLEAGERWIESMQANIITNPAITEPTPRADGRRPSPLDDDTRPWPRSLCGRRLYFGGSPLQISCVKLVATPASMRKMNFAISQGELYKGQVNLTELREAATRKLLDVLWCPGVGSYVDSPRCGANADDDEGGNRASNSSSGQNESSTCTADAQHKATPADMLLNAGRSESRADDALRGGVQNVMIKVTSVACHRMLLIPEQAILWDMAEERRWSQVVQDIHPLLSESLHAIHLTGGFKRNFGLVQILPDLQAADFIPLQPQAVLDRKLMCKAFQNLIARTLVPLALHRVVHADIRPGYQETANIMYRAQGDHCFMLLIDLDSLLDIKHFKNLPEDDRILSPENGWYSERIGSALEFVCLQSVCIARSWLIGKQLADTASDESTTSRLKKELNTENIIKNYLLENIEDGECFGENRSKFFSCPESSACSFVLDQIHPILEEFLGDKRD